MNWPAFYNAELRTAEVLQKQSLAVYDDPDHAAPTDLQTPWPLLGPAAPHLAPRPVHLSEVWSECGLAATRGSRDAVRCSQHGPLGGLHMDT